MDKLFEIKCLEAIPDGILTSCFIFHAIDQMFNQMGIKTASLIVKDEVKNRQYLSSAKELKEKFPDILNQFVYFIAKEDFKKGDIAKLEKGELIKCPTTTTPKN